jgi:reactive intermediate/imine deaminase
MKEEFKLVQYDRKAGQKYNLDFLGLESAKEVHHFHASDYKNVVKTTIFLTDMNDFAAVNKIYESYFGGDFPARSCIQVAKLPLGGLVEVECVAEL